MPEITPADNRDEYSVHLNPDYGSGIFRRRIHLAAESGRVVAQLEDSAHGFRATLEHDGTVVTGIRGESLRTPYDICAGATEPIKAFVGQRIDTPAARIVRIINPFKNCTHLYDLSALALEMCQLHETTGATERQIDVIIPDEQGEPVDARVLIDGDEVLLWQVLNWQITGPAEVAGKPFYRGFAAWVNETLSGLESTAAFALQKGYLVSESRRYDMNAIAGQAPEIQEGMKDICYTYSSERVNTGIRLRDTMRDFTDCEEQLLTFK